MRLEELGKLAASRAVADLQESNKEFAVFVVESLGKYIRNDWGNVSKYVKKKNDMSIKYVDDRILASYLFPTDAPWQNDNHRVVKENNIWIITEWDRSVTKILFPGEHLSAFNRHEPHRKEKK